MRTNIELDASLVERLMEMTGIRTKRKLVDKALRELERKAVREWALSLEGKLTDWEGDIDEERRNKVT